MSTQSSKYFYATNSWDEAAWTDVISIEYESLVSAYPFDTKLRETSSGDRLKILDVGCGSAIFPHYLDQTLSDDLHLACDLLDVSQRSLKQAEMVLGELEHFSAGQNIRTLIEDIPEAVPHAEPGYEVIWAIHSFTTVDLEQMSKVIDHLLHLLRPDGRMFIYQLAADSAYQTLHQVYRERVSDTVPRFMEYEDTQRILESLSAEYEVLELQFDHRLPRDQPEVMENYLRKCVLDESVDTEKVFGDVLSRYESGGMYRIPQFVNFLSVSLA
ncbi:MAG: class I SAM-dependent methyltransferase [Anaerolineales bacterium]